MQRVGTGEFIETKMNRIRSKVRARAEERHARAWLKSSHASEAKTKEEEEEEGTTARQRTHSDGARVQATGAGANQVRKFTAARPAGLARRQRSF